MVEAVAKPQQKREGYLDPLPNQAFKVQQDLVKLLRDSKAEASMKNLHEHIVEVVDRIVMSCPDKAIECFEEVSYLIKNGDKVKLEEFIRVNDKRDYAVHCDQTAAGTKDHIESLKKILATGEEAAGDGDGDGGDKAASSNIQDLMSLNKNVWNQAGIDFGEYSTLILQKSLKELTAKSQATFLRFWGKILGTEKDYYVVEGSAPAPEDGAQRPEDFEPRGTGINAMAYWVSNSPSGPWEALDDLETSDLAASRTFRVQFTGDLNREIITNPFYFKKEKDYLRAQIARITHTTKLMPKGVYRLKEDDPTDIEENIPEEGDNPVAPIPTTEEMKKAENWVHFGQNILKCNRLKHMEVNPETLDPEADADAVTAKIIAADPFEKRLKPITLDKGCKGNYPAWILRSYGDC